MSLRLILFTTGFKKCDCLLSGNETKTVRRYGSFPRSPLDLITRFLCEQVAIIEGIIASSRATFVAHFGDIVDGLLRNLGDPVPSYGAELEMLLKRLIHNKGDI